MSSGATTASKVTEGGLPLGVLSFGTPLAIGMALYATFNVVDMVLVSRLEEATSALAALAMCDMANAVFGILSNGISNATVAVVARRHGQNDTEGVARAVAQSLLIIGVLSVVFGLTGVLGSEAFVSDVLGARGEARRLAVPYLQVIVGGTFSILLLLQTSAILRALGAARASAGMLIFGNLLNVILDVVLIYGTGPYPTGLGWVAPIAQALDIPRMGLLGAAVATVIGRALPAIVGVILIARMVGPLRPHLRRPHRGDLKALISVGWPSSLQQLLHITAILAFMAALNRYFTTDTDQTLLSAYGICLRFEMFALFVSLGWGSAAATYVGMNLGAEKRERAKRSGWLAAAYALVTLGLLVGLYLAFPRELIAFFDPTPAVVEAGRNYLVWVAWSYGLLGVGAVLSQAMTGSGDTIPSMFIDGGAFWLLGVPAVAWAAATSATPTTAFAAMSVVNVLAGLAFVAWYARGSFLDKRVE